MELDIELWVQNWVWRQHVEMMINVFYSKLCMVIHDGAREEINYCGYSL